MVPACDMRTSLWRQRASNDLNLQDMKNIGASLLLNHYFFIAEIICFFMKKVSTVYNLEQSTSTAVEMAQGTLSI